MALLNDITSSTMQFPLVPLQKKGVKWGEKWADSRPKMLMLAPYKYQASERRQRSPKFDGFTGVLWCSKRALM